MKKPITLRGHVRRADGRNAVPCGRYQVSALAGDGGVWTAERELKSGSSDTALQVGGVATDQ